MPRWIVSLCTVAALAVAGPAGAQEAARLLRVEQARLPVLAAGEMAFTTDTHRLYVGDGRTNWLIGGDASALVTGTVVRPIVDMGGEVFDVRAYGASGSEVVTATTAAAAAGATDVAVVHPTSFLPGQGIYIEGAGPSGGPYVGTVRAIRGAEIRVAPGLDTAVPAGAVVQHDDTAAVRAAVAACLGVYDPVRQVAAARGPIYFGAGTYRISAPIAITSSQGVVLRGAGQVATKIVSSVPMAAMLDLDGFNSGHVEDMAILAASAVDKVVDIYWRPEASHQTTSRVVVDRVYVAYTGAGTFATGIQTGTTNNFNCAGITLRDVTVTGDRAHAGAAAFRAGIRLGMPGFGGNNNNIDLEAVTCVRLAAGIDIASATQIKIGMYSGTENDVDIVCPNAMSYVAITGARSEGAHAFYNTASTQSFAIPGHLRISDLFFSLDSVRESGPVITVTNAGSAILENIHFAGRSPYVATVKCTAQAPVGLTVIGMVQAGDRTLEESFDFTTRPQFVNGVVIDFSTTNAALHTSAVVPFRLVEGGRFVKLPGARD